MTTVGWRVSADSLYLIELLIREHCMLELFVHILYQQAYLAKDISGDKRYRHTWFGWWSEDRHAWEASQEVGCLYKIGGFDVYHKLPDLNSKHVNIIKK
jgi:hypothetical protein